MELPLSGDKNKFIDDLERPGISVHVFIHRLAGFNLWLLYTWNDDVVSIRALVDAPP